MGTTPTRKLPYPELSDSPDVPRDIKALALAVDDALPRLVFASVGSQHTFANNVPFSLGTASKQTPGTATLAGTSDAIILERKGLFLIIVWTRLNHPSEVWGTINIGVSGSSGARTVIASQSGSYRGAGFQELTASVVHESAAAGERVQLYTDSQNPGTEWGPTHCTVTWLCAA